MNIPALNAVIAAAAKHGFRFELDFNIDDRRAFSVLRDVGRSTQPDVLYRGTDPSAAIEAINRAVTPQPDRYYTLDEAVAVAESPLPWCVKQKESLTRLLDSSGTVVAEHDSDAYESEMGLSESQAILAAHCVTQLPRLVAAVDILLAGDDGLSPELELIRTRMNEANRVPGKVVVS